MYTYLCRICGCKSFLQKTGRVINGYSLAQCSFCDTVMVERQPSSTALKDTYDHLFNEGEYDQHRIEYEKLKTGKRLSPNFYRRQLLSNVERMSKGKTMIEIGGGTGSFGIISKSRGWEYSNFDISESAINFCKSLSLNAFKFELGSTPPIQPESADVVVAWEVIEHIWNLYEYLEVIIGGLKPGGVFLFSTPNYLTPSYQKSDKWGVLGSPPIHLNFFSTESLKRTLEITTFSSVSIKKKRIYMPNINMKSILKSLRFALYMEEPVTLLGIARKNEFSRNERMSN